MTDGIYQSEDVVVLDSKFEYARLKSTQIITEQGIYKKDEVPEDYGGSQLEVDVVHGIYLINETGELTQFQFKVPEAKDENEETGGPYTLDEVEIKAGAGPSTVATELELVVDTTLVVSDETLDLAVQWIIEHFAPTWSRI